MSQRNIQHARYQDETKPKGVTKKSTSQLKPKKKAAASVYTASKTKTKEEKKKIRKEQERLERKEAARARREQANPPTERYKKLRQLWWVALGVAVVFLLISWVGRPYLPEYVDIAAMVISYVGIIAALYIDLGLIRKERKRYEEEQAMKKSKYYRRKEKAARIEAIKAEEAEEAERKKQGLFGYSKKKATKAADSVVEKQQAAKAAKEK